MGRENFLARAVKMAKVFPLREGETCLLPSSLAARGMVDSVAATGQFKTFIELSDIFKNLFLEFLTTNCRRLTL